MRLAFCWLAAVTFAQAGVIQGVVLEQASGFALARTSLRLDPIPTPNGGNLKPLQIRNGRRGEFVFLGVPDGMYMLTAIRPDYAPTSYGQRRPGGYGTPIQVTADSSIFAELRMVRMGAISGRVLDENGVGIAGVPVIAYRARLPLRQAGHAESDDRGVYRIHGLDPGKYWIRSAAATLDDGTGLLPTFAPQSRDVRNARVEQVQVDYETQYADVTPEAGSLFTLRGKITCAPEPVAKSEGSPPAPINVTLSSETGRRSAELYCNQTYQFSGLAPAHYEVFGQSGDSAISGFVELNLDHDNDLGGIQLTPSPEVRFMVTRAGRGETNTPVTIEGRRDDLSEIEEPRAIKLPRTNLPSGHWDMQGKAAPGEYIESIGTPMTQQQLRALGEQLPDDSFLVLIANRAGMTVQVVVAEPAGAIAGGVANAGNPVPGAPVFLWPVKDETRRQLGGPRQLLSNTDGKFRFDGLPPGDYRLLASFDFREVDEELVNLANAVQVRVEAPGPTAADLTVYVAP